MPPLLTLVAIFTSEFQLQILGRQKGFIYVLYCLSEEPLLTVSASVASGIIGIVLIQTQQNVLSDICLITRHNDCFTSHSWLL